MTVTREGRGLLLTMALIGLAALNTGNNLIYLMLSLMTALLILDLIEGWRNLHKVQGTVQAAGPVFAAAPTEIQIILSNRTRRPRFLIESRCTAPTFHHVVPRLEALRTHRSSLTIRFQRRGRHRFQHAVLSSAYPFGFFQFTQPVSSHGSVLVYPELLDTKRLLNPLRHAVGTGLVPAPAGEDFSELRPYRPGDRMRDIHWKATAKTGNMMVRELRVGIARHITLILDGQPGDEPERFEKAVSMAATLLHGLFDAGHPVRLVCPDGATGLIRERDQLYQAMDLLAMVQPDPRWMPDTPTAGSFIRLVVTAAERGQVPESMRATEVLDADSV